MIVSCDLRMRLSLPVLSNAQGVAHASSKHRRSLRYWREAALLIGGSLSGRVDDILQTLSGTETKDDPYPRGTRRITASESPRRANSRGAIAPRRQPVMLDFYCDWACRAKEWALTFKR